MSFSRSYHAIRPQDWLHTAKGLGVASLLALSMLGLLGAVPATHASTVVTITTSNGSLVCVSGFLGSSSASWSSSTDTCSSTGTFSLSSGTLDVGSGVTLSSTTCCGAYGFYISGGTVDNYGTMSGSSGTGNGLSSHGVINNYGTIRGVSGGVGTGYGIYNSGTLNNEGSVSGTDDTHEGFVNAGTTYNSGSLSGTGDYAGIVNYRSIRNYGTLTGSGVAAGTGISNHGSIFNDGTVTGKGGPSGSKTGGYGVYNPDVIENYGTVSGSAVGWGLYNTGTLTNYCGSTVKAAAAYGHAPNNSLFCPAPPIPAYAMPEVLGFTTYGNESLTGYRVDTLGITQVIYNIPSLNISMLDIELAQGNDTLLPHAVQTCSFQVGGHAYVRETGFFSAWWGGSSLNSTEIVFSDYGSFTFSAQGWPSVPACAG